MKKILVAGVAMLALAACNSGTNNSSVAATTQVAAVAPPAGTEWATTVTKTPDGGYLMGNPAAPIKLMEYGSVTCPTCMAFSVQGSEALKDKYIATGRVSFEFRSFLIHGPDPMVTTLLECGGPGSFFGLLESSYASFDSWMNKIQSLSAAEQQRIQSLPTAAQMTALAEASGYDQFVIQRGVGSEAAKQCLSDPATPERLLKQRDKAIKDFDVQGTPTFYINGKVVQNVSAWKDLEPMLRAAGA